MTIYNSHKDQNSDDIKNFLIKGPIINVVISAPQIVVATKEKNGTLTPLPIVGLGLIDTGCSSTSVDKNVFLNLGIKHVSENEVFTANGPSNQRIYPCGLKFPDIFSNIFQVKGVYACDLSGQEYIALIGRDILADSIFIYNGKTGQFSIAF